MAHALAVLKFIDGASVRRFAKAGHYPHREAASDFLPELMSFLDQDQPEPRLRLGVRSPRTPARKSEPPPGFRRLARTG